jgi:hypothetical protein
LIDPTEPEKEINRIERELDAINPPAEKPPVRRGGPTGKPENSKSMDAVLVAAVLLFAISAALSQLFPAVRRVLPSELDHDSRARTSLESTVELNFEEEREL